MILSRCSVDDALALTGGDPFLRSQLRYGSGPAWASAGAVAVVGLDLEERIRQLSGLPHGPDSPRETAALVTEVIREVPEIPRITVPCTAAPYLPAGLLASSNDWNFRSTTAPPPHQPGQEAARWLAAEEEAGVRELLTMANPESSAWPGDAKVARWAGIRGANGQLVACLADTSGPGVGHLSGIATHPRARGRGLGAAITAWATRYLLAEHVELVTLGLYADNDAAHRLYSRLGFRDDHRFTSGPVNREPR